MERVVREDSAWFGNLHTCSKDFSQGEERGGHQIMNLVASSPSHHPDG